MFSESDGLAARCSHRGTFYGDQTIAAGKHRDLPPGFSQCHGGAALRLLREPLCVYKVSVLGVFEYFLSLYHSVSIFLSFAFLISSTSYYG